MAQKIKTKAIMFGEEEIKDGDEKLRKVYGVQAIKNRVTSFNCRRPFIICRKCGIEAFKLFGHGNEFPHKEKQCGGQLVRVYPVGSLSPKTK